MLKKKVSSKRLRIISKVLILPLISIGVLSFFAYTQFEEIFKPEKKQPVIEAEQRDSQEEPEKLDPPSKPEVEEEKPEQEEEKPVEQEKEWWEYPDQILPATRSGNDLLVLVNKEYKLPSSYAPNDLVTVSSSVIRSKSGGSYQLRQILMADLKDLNSAAKGEGIDISIVSAYRSYNTQASTYQYWVNYNNGNAAAADTVSARPGHSQHQLGTAMDFSSNEIGDRLGAEFDSTKAAKWLNENSWKYGFVLAYPKGYEATTGYSHESWHYRYIGTDNAQEWKNSGKILEVWLQQKNNL